MDENTPIAPSTATAAVADLLLGPEDGAEPTEPVEADAAAEAPAEAETEEAPAEEAPPEEPQPAGHKWSLQRLKEMSPDEWTPELLQDAVGWAHKAIGKAHSKLNRLKRDRETLHQERSTFVEARDSHIATVRTLRDRNAEPNRRLHALGQLANDDPMTLFEDLIREVAGVEKPADQKKDKPSLTAEDVARLVEERIAAQQQQAQASGAFESQLRSGLEDASQFPYLAERVSQVGADTAFATLMRVAQKRLEQTGQAVSVRAILVEADQAEARAARLKGAAPQSGSRTPSMGGNQRAQSPTKTPVRIAAAKPGKHPPPKREDRLEAIASALLGPR